MRAERGPHDALRRNERGGSVVSLTPPGLYSGKCTNDVQSCSYLLEGWLGKTSGPNGLVAVLATLARAQGLRSLRPWWPLRLLQLLQGHQPQDRAETPLVGAAPRIFASGVGAQGRSWPVNRRGAVPVAVTPSHPSPLDAPKAAGASQAAVPPAAGSPAPQRDCVCVVGRMAG
eukprot:gene8501-biopygen10653